ncbi:MAG: hypothetical protein JW894_13055 [Bacteroidales bacterium]|nr:hypothetical protein [Bacteroidales bacterium]
MSEWDGKSKGTPLGYKIIIFIIKHIHIRVAYFFVWFIALYYYLTVNKQYIYFFYHTLLHFKPLKAHISVYRNYLVFGKSMIDKIAIISGNENSFTFDFEGENHLHDMANTGKGGIIIGAHAGNWEIAGHLLKRINKPVHVVMYDGERSNIKELIEEVTGGTSFNLILIKDDDLSHIYFISDALRNGDLIAMHGDRYRDDSKTTECDFFGMKADFPLGPFFLASQFDVPFCFVSTMKESNTHYHFHSTEPLKIEKEDKELVAQHVHLMAKYYATNLEKTVRKYPYQWFNYYNFWKTK